MTERKQKPALHLQQAGNKLPNMFFIGIARKLAALVSWGTTPVFLC